MLLQLVEPGVTSPQEEQYAVGIDLGTTHSLVAISHQGTPRIIPIEDNLLTPSVIHQELTGNLANQHVQAIRSFKRFMKTPLQKIVDQKDAVVLSAQLLKHLKTHAERELNGQEIKKAVITVPAYFDDTARQATKDAAVLAGLIPIRLINEPTAAALAYGLNHKVKGNFLIYDLGGGTFDVSILNLKDNIFQVVATQGDTELGGDDIDLAITKFWMMDPTPEYLLLAKKAKETVCNGQVFEAGELYLNEEKLNAISITLIEKTIQIVKETLENAHLSVEQIDDIILVGGSTRLKLIHKIIEERFAKKPRCDINPDHAVALGAAIQAENLTVGLNRLLLDVNPLSLGIETMGGLVEKIIPRNSPLPISMAQEFTTHVNGQTKMLIHVVQGEREFVKDCRSLARFELSNIPPMTSGAARIRVTFMVDADGLLNVTATEQISGVRQSVHVKPTYGLSSEDFEKMLNDSFVHAQEDMEKRFSTQTIFEAEQILSFVKHALEEDVSLLDPQELELIKTKIFELTQAMDRKDRHEINKKTKDLSHVTQPFAERRIENSIKKKLLQSKI